MKETIKEIHIEDFDYPLDNGRIPRFPLRQRDSCRLIVTEDNGAISHHIFSELPSLLKPDTLMVANETKVINARMDFRKATGAHIEIFILEPFAPADYALAFATRGECCWSCLVGNRKKWKQGVISKSVDVEGSDMPVTLTAEITGEAEGATCIVRFKWANPDVTFASIVEAAGNIPIPPYLKRNSEESDKTDYQTVYSRIQGSVAAPTAGLHFTPALIKRLEEKGIGFHRLVLHVGAGTFQPVKSETIGAHPMHTEVFRVTRSLVEALISALEDGSDILAVGTTSVRTIESLPYLGILMAQGEERLHIPQWMAYEEKYAEQDTLECLRRIISFMDIYRKDEITASTAIMIAPGFNWRIVNRMVTNFHQPQSTLLLLVSSFLNPEGMTAEPRWRQLYEEALAHDYRFLSYGDACLLSRGR